MFNKSSLWVIRITDIKLISNIGIGNIDIVHKNGRQLPACFAPASGLEPETL